MGPIEVARHSLECLFAAKMAARGSVMKLMNDSSSQIGIIRDNSARSIELIDAVGQQVSIKLVPIHFITHRAW